MFAKLVNEIISENTEDEFSERNQITPLEDLDDKAKYTYIKILCNYALSDDDIIDSKEYAEIINFIVRVKLDKSYRIPLRMYMMGEEEQQSTSELLHYLEEACYEEEFELIVKSLVKDIISIFMLKKDKNWEDDQFIVKITEKYNISYDQIVFFISSYKQTQDILTNRLDDKEIAKKYIDLNTKAGIAGIPLAALFLTGTGGVSAAGITSGFSILGMSSIIGISSLFSGIGTLAIFGLVSYQGLQTIMGVKGQQKNNKHRELMLKEIVKNKQLQLQYLIEDNNSLIEQLANAILLNEENSEKIKKLALIAKNVGKSQTKIAKDVVDLEKEDLLMNVPKRISIDKIEELVNSRDKEHFKANILSCYTEGEDKTLILKSDITSEQSEKLIVALNKLGFFNMPENLTASVKSVTKSTTKATSTIFDKVGSKISERRKSYE